MIEVLFWSCLGLIGYTYIGYPLILVILSALKKHEGPDRTAEGLPAVTLIISMYNEELIVQEKLENLKSIEYPASSLEILIGSDGSTDQTSHLLDQSDVANLHVYAFPKRRGKASVINDLVKIAKGEIIVFSDANTMFRPETVKELVRPFSEKTVGAVSGELILEGKSNSGESLYWKYETFIKRLESKVGTLLGATGGVYAIRKDLFVPVPAGNSLADDFVIPMTIVRQGYRVAFSQRALASERGEASVKGEFQRKVRIGAQNFNAVPLFHSFLQPSAGFVGFAFWSHKILRWFVPFLLFGLLMATVILEPLGPLYRWSLATEIIFILLAVIGAIAEGFGVRHPVVSLPYYFLAMNAALFAGFVRSLFGIQSRMWDVQR